ncbi:MAG: FAD binding domain-containing protein [Acidobacteriota bacterium]|jgi:NADPH-dependent glutamate synthase beta subunit-like oxidoreductase|nr:FAD binding domain-containing protein [Acidobacteriota bacterium]
MKTFQHYNARSLKHAASLLAKHKGKARINAGGTDLLSDLRDGCLADYPEALVNIKTIPNLDYIKAGPRGIRIGALTRLADVVESPVIKQDYALLAEAAHSVASPNIRNMATVGGNLAQDVRCWYYRYPQQIGGPITCLRKGGTTCSALLGDNRYHSIFGAAPTSDRRCASHCPAHIDIPGYLRLIRENKMPEAARALLCRNPFPAITGRVCPIFCEPNCNRGDYDEPVAIHSVERAVGDYILKHAADYFAPPAVESGKKIAIVGSGPAGLAAAYYLRKSGHQVTVYERLPEAGGMLFYSIPPYRLPKEIVRTQIRALSGMGIRFEVGVSVESALAQKIQLESDAVFVAGGTWRSLKLNVPGEDAAGVFSALDYLKQINSGEPQSLGRKVIVVGGGSVAIDAARTARRTGAEEVHLVCLETRDLASKDRMLALDPEIREAEEEGIVIHPCLGIREITVTNGKACGIETKRCLSVRDAEGRFNPQFDMASPSQSLQADAVIVAIGQSADAEPFAPGGKVFVGGDMAEGPSTVIQAVASAHKAVGDIKALFGEKEPETEENACQPEYAASHFDSIPRITAREMPAVERLKGIHIEDIAGIHDSEIQTEARRCVSCGCLAVGPSDLATSLMALDASIVTSKRTLSAGAFFAASGSNATVLEPDELIKEVQIPKPPKGARQRYLKFTLRKPIDFAVASVASLITEKNGVCVEARILLGAVGPAPVRATAAEKVLKGKPLTEETAAEAAKASVAAAQPLAMNGYKVTIARTLVKRAILGVAE